jgi:hypothetical protein
MMRSGISLSLALGLVLFAARNGSATDYWDLATNKDNSLLQTKNTLVHGSSQQHDLEVNPGPVADQDWYFTTNYLRTSSEAVIDAAGGDLNMQDVANLQRFDVAGALLQTSEETNPGLFGSSIALRWQNTGTPFDLSFLRVQCTTCGIGGPEDQYRIRYFDTTIAVPRFNNAGGQVTVLIVQNPTGWTRNIAGTVYFWGATGTLLGSTTFSLAEKATLVLNTTTVPGVAGQGGAITIAHDGGYGNLAVKAVALEPATGFSFDSPGVYKPQ